jgi:hypothetical protein
MSELIGKEYILERLDPEQIYEHYIGAQVFPGKSIISPFRKETHASFNIYYNGKGQLVWKDFAGEWGTVFDLVMLMFRCSLSEACKKIANDFGLVSIAGLPSVKVVKRIVDKPVKKPVEITYNARKWKWEDIEFWNTYGVSFETLKEYNVLPIRDYILKTQNNGELRFRETSSPMYLYDYRNGRYKIYSPKANDKRYKFVGNTKGDDIFGLYELKYTNHKLSLIEKRPYISWIAILCGGQKDVMSLYHMAGIRAVCLGSESTRLTETILSKIRPYCEHLIVCYDNDKTGKSCATKINEEFGIPILDISKFTIKKDISDFFMAGGNYMPLHKEILKLINLQESLI